ncbi:hypothetical protein B0A55_04364 [Friedmanniomyces simplex]|uniref:Uncharacterized protein n=1 Tax=Friedmanniomyces simplex TaxID=329884 RepID=A0A4U0XT43_9PEZI|nr:hypothetical protein B0A55_04364 [Friedmanniomyces simplex]
MTARRSNRIAGEKLSNEIGEIERHGRIRFYLDRRAEWETEHADVSCKFTIFDLLPELRTKIYAYAMAKEQPREVTLLKTPVLAMVSKQIRAEALPVFFAECMFTVSVRSNYQYQQELDALAARQELPTGPWAAITTRRHRQLVARSYSSGIIACVEKQTKAMLAGLRDWGHSTTAFRNLELRVHGPVVGGGLASKCETSVMVIRVPTASKPRPMIT